MKKSGKSAGVSDKAVQAKTGKRWQEWFALLDKAGARKMTHAQIAAHLYDELGCPSWWNQMVAVGYERDRGLRVKHETPQGFQISRSKTIAAALADVFKAWNDKKLRRRWLADPGFTVRKANENKSLRITWVDGRTSLEVNFYAKGTQKCQVSVQHNKLSDAEQAEEMKAYWAEQLDRLKDWLENR